MRSSIIRRTLWLASLIPLIFIVDFGSTYWTNKRFVKGLAIIHDADTDFDQISHASTSLNSAMEALRSYVEKPDPAKRTAFQENLKHAEQFSEPFRDTPSGARISQGLSSIRESGGRVTAAPERSPLRKGELLISSQFALETEEEFRKVQFRVKGDSQHAFDRIYGDRWLPLVVSTVLDILFLVLLFFLIVPPVRLLIGSVKNLAHATDRIMAGESDYQAPVLSDDELGKATDAFNRMVTSLNLKEQEGKTLLREAKEAIQTRDDFLSIASHELRTPLTPLRMQIQMLGRSLTRAQELTPARIQDVIATCERMVTRLSRLVDDLLEVSRINSGRLDLQYEEIDFAALIRDILVRFQFEVDRVGSTVDLRAPDSIRGEFDPGKVEQIFVNLLTNALKYGEGKPIEIEVESDPNWVTLRVKDRGVGIAKRDQKRIFGRFERAINPTANISGLGLGLFITAQIVELHGGKISVESDTGQGSTFTVRLPLARTSAVVSRKR